MIPGHYSEKVTSFEHVKSRKKKQRELMTTERRRSKKLSGLPTCYGEQKYHLNEIIRALKCKKQDGCSATCAIRMSVISQKRIVVWANRKSGRRPLRTNYRTWHEDTIRTQIRRIPAESQEPGKKKKPSASKCCAVHTDRTCPYAGDRRKAPPPGCRERSRFPPKRRWSSLAEITGCCRQWTSVLRHRISACKKCGSHLHLTASWKGGGGEGRLHQVWHCVDSQQVGTRCDVNRKRVRRVVFWKHRTVSDSLVLVPSLSLDPPLVEARSSLKSVNTGTSASSIMPRPSGAVMSEKLHFVEMRRERSEEARLAHDVSHFGLVQHFENMEAHADFSRQELRF